MFTKQDAMNLGAKCDECPLSSSFNGVPTDFGDGNIAFVGEAPSRGDQRVGRTFSGAGGGLLDLVMEHHDIDRKDVTLTNACLCRPIDGTAPPKSAIVACRPRLLRELEQSDTIVALGNSAALATLGTEGITTLRVGPGKGSPYEELRGKRIIPTLHPAACLRQSDNFPFLVTDIGKIEGAVDAYTPPEWRLLDNVVDAIRVLGEFEGRAEPLVVDIEVDIEKDTAYDHPQHYELLCVGLGSEELGIVVLDQDMCAHDDVRAALRDCLRACPLIAQNGMFDLAGLYPVVGPLELWFDTMLASYCLDERPGIHGLKVQAVEYLGMPEYDKFIKKYLEGPTLPELEQYHGYGRIPRDELYRYNAYDIDATLRLYKIQVLRLGKVGKPDWWDEWYPDTPFKSLRDLHDFLAWDGTQLMYLELNGIKIDRDRNKELTVQYTESIARLIGEARQVLKESGLPNWETYNPNSPQQVKKALYHLKIQVPDTTADTIQLVKERLMEHPAEIGTRDFALDYIDLHQVIKKEAKLFGTYVKGITKRMYGGKIYSSYLLHGTTTGRLASRNPNMQNIPRLSIIKNQFVPTKDVFVQADYPQAELRILTWMAKEEYFRDILNDPERDLFDELTPMLYPNAPRKDECTPETWKEYRIRVKAFVYGLGYGRTHYTIASEFKMPMDEAERVKNNFFQVIPSIVEFQSKTKRMVRDGKDLITPFGRHRRFHLITKENWKSVQNEALAFLPQSTSSDVCLRAFARVRRDLSGSGAYARNIVHDSILVDCSLDMVDDVGAILQKHMTESAEELVGGYVTNFTPDLEIGTDWGFK